MYRTEHPKPQFMRESWKNLNGTWDFLIDHGNSGEARKFYESAPFDRKIEVPFCPESALSGVAYTDFMNSVWYRRTVSFTEEELAGDILLHFGAVDYKASVYVNGILCDTHKGGYVSFAVDITKAAKAGENVITVHAEDDSRDPMIPHGKQSEQYHSYGCMYTRTTGIWQTVWLEFVPKTRIASVKYYPNIYDTSLTVEAKLLGKGDLTLSASFAGAPMGEVTAKDVAGTVTLNLPLAEKHLWEIGKGDLYDLTLTFGEDKVQSYFGLRAIRLDGMKFMLNDKPIFQRLVLDQGFFPDGIYTAPSDAELKGDIERSLAMGFNGARLHEKIFEERFLYHADKLGYIVWGEYPNWGLNVSKPEAIYSVLPEWCEELARDFNHPAIVGWCPFNETWDCAGHPQHAPILEMVYHTTKAIDPTRPCIDTSGSYHVVTDIFDLHDYCGDPAEYARRYADFDGTSLYDDHAHRQQYIPGTPVFISEYGGIGWNVGGDRSWSYGNAPKTEEEFLARLKGLTDVLLDNPNINGYCYTQLTDVEQEQNGLYTYDRQAKFPPEVIRPILSREAAAEK